MESIFIFLGDAASKYGPLLMTVKGAGFLLATVFTLSLGWMRRSGSSWAPPEEALPKITTRFASLITGVLLALVYAFLHQSDRTPLLAIITFFTLIFALCGLLLTIYLIKKYGFEVKRRNWRGKEVTTIKLGGSQFTHDAAEARRIRHVEVDRLYEEAQGDLRLIFTRESIARIHAAVTATFLLFQSFGSLALGGAGLLLSISSAA